MLMVEAREVRSGAVAPGIRRGQPVTVPMSAVYGGSGGARWGPTRTRGPAGGPGTGERGADALPALRAGAEVTA